jgi:hypothetical protein
MSPEKPENKNPRQGWKDNLKEEFDGLYQKHLEKIFAEDAFPLSPEEFRIIDHGRIEVITGASAEEVRDRFEKRGWEIVSVSSRGMMLDAQTPIKPGEQREVIFVGRSKMVFRKRK